MRLRDWEARLTAWVAARAGAPFVWGQTDCALIAMEAFDALTGRALAAAYRGLWPSLRAARAYAPGFDLVQTLVRQGCATLSPSAGLRIGDFLMVKRRAWWCAHVCCGALTLSAWPRLGVAWGETRAVLAIDPAVVRVPFR